MAQTFNEAIEITTQKRLDSAIETERNAICTGQMTQEQYKYRCGVIKGMENAKAILLEAKDDLQKGT